MGYAKREPLHQVWKSALLSALCIRQAGGGRDKTLTAEAVGSRSELTRQSR